MTQCEKIVKVIKSNGGVVSQKSIIKYFTDLGTTFNYGILRLRLELINKNPSKYKLPKGYMLVLDETSKPRTVCLVSKNPSENVEKTSAIVTANSLWNNAIKIKDMDKKHLARCIKLLNEYGKDRTKKGVDGFETQYFGNGKIKDWITQMAIQLATK